MIDSSKGLKCTERILRTVPDPDITIEGFGMSNKTGINNFRGDLFPCFCVQRFGEVEGCEKGSKRNEKRGICEMLTDANATSETEGEQAGVGVPWCLKFACEDGS